MYDTVVASIDLKYAEQSLQSVLMEKCSQKSKLCFIEESVTLIQYPKEGFCHA